MAKLNKLKTDPQIVHPRISRNGSKNTPESRGQKGVFVRFSAKLSKNGQFSGSKRVVLAKLVKNDHFLAKISKIHKNGDLAILFGQRRGL